MWHKDGRAMTHVVCQRRFGKVTPFINNISTARGLLSHEGCSRWSDDGPVNFQGGRTRIRFLSDEQPRFVRACTFGDCLQGR